MSLDWYYLDSEKIVGPLPDQEIINLAKMAIIGVHTKLRRGENGEWKPARSYTTIASIFDNQNEPAPKRQPSQAKRVSPIVAGPVKPPVGTPTLPRAAAHAEPDLVRPLTRRPLFWVTLGGGACALAAVGIAFGFWLLRTDQGGNQVVPNVNGNTAEASTASKGLAESTGKPTPSDDQDDVLFAFLKNRKETAKLSGQQVYERLLQSSVLIINMDGGGEGSGSGFLVDAKNRIVVTNHHVVSNESSQKLKLDGKSITVAGQLNILSPPDPVRGTRCRIYRFVMLQGEQFQIDMISNNFDTYLRLEDSLGIELAQDDDSGGNLNARVVFTATRNDDYRIIATSFTNQSGTFILRVTPLQTKQKSGSSDETNAAAVFASFPIYQNGKIVTGYKNYRKELLANAQKFRAKVIYSDPVKDLALLQLSELPTGAKPLSLAKESSKPGQNVHSVGNPGASDSSWIYTSGTVRTGPYIKKWTSSNAGGGSVLNHDATVIETQSPINSGDSGGPLVNDASELLAVTQGSSRRADLVNFFVDVGEVKTVLKSKGFSWAEGTSNLGDPRKSLSSSDAAKLAQLLAHSKPHVRIQAAAYLADAGEQGRFAATALTKALDDKDPEVRRSSAFALAAIGIDALPGLRQALNDSSPDVRQIAIQGLIKLGPDAGPAVTELVALFTSKDRDTARRAFDAVMAIGPRSAAVPGLVLALRESSVAVRLWAIQSLAKLGPDAKEALPSLLGELQPKERAVSNAVLEAVNSIGAKDAAVPQLRKLIRADTPEARQWVVQSLGKLGAHAEKALPELVEALDDKDSVVAESALEAIAKVGPRGAKAVIAMSRVLEKATPDIQKIAQEPLANSIVSLTEDKQAAQEALPALVKLYAGQNARLQQAAASVLHGMGTGLRPAFPDLIQMLDSRELSEQFDILKLLAQCADSKEKQSLIVPRVAKLLSEKDEGNKLASLKILAALGPDSKAAFQLVFYVYEKERSKELRLQALQALSSLGLHAKEAIPRLVDDVKQFGEAYSDKEIYRAVVVCLSKLGEPAAKAVLKLVGDPKFTTRIRAAEVLGMMGPEMSQFTLKPLMQYYREVENNPAVRDAMKKAMDQIRK